MASERVRRDFEPSGRIETLLARISGLVQQRQAMDASSAAAREANRLEIVRCQLELSRAALESFGRSLPSTAPSSAVSR